MTKNNAKKRSLHSNKEHPGCMGGFFGLFDFHQHPSGRKLISDKAHADGAHASRNSFDVASESLETPKSKDARNEHEFHTYDPRKNPSTKKKAGGLPMKKLIAEEMSKELESKRCTPSVVARLMGLEAMPAEAMLAEHTQELKSDPKKTRSGKQQQQPNSNRDGRISPQKLRASASKPTQEISSLVSEQKSVSCPDQRALHCARDHSHEKQRQELRKDTESSKSGDCPKTQNLDDLSIPLVEKHMVVHETLDEEKMALVRQKFIDAKNLSTNEKFQESKEFLEALEVFQSNKDLFLKFLQEPNSLFAKNLQDLQSTLQIPETEKTKVKSANVKKTAEELKRDDTSHGRYSMEGKKHDKQLQMQKGSRFLTGRDEEWQVRSSSSVTNDQYKQYSTTSAPVKSDSCSLPTRIVVLKPGPGSGQHARSPSPQSWSPHSQAAFRSLSEGDKASTRDFLQEVRERLKFGLKENRKVDSRITQDGQCGQIYDGPKDPREIAREIARQVRESVTRDSTNGPSELGEISTSFTNLHGNKNALNGSRTSPGEADISSDNKISTSTTKHSLNYTVRSGISASHSPSKSHSTESTVCKEAKKRLSERLKLSHVNEEKQQSRGNLNTLGKMLALQEDKKPIVGPKNPKSNSQMSNGIEESQQLSRQVRCEFGTNCTYHNDGDENEDISPESIVICQSVKKFDKDNEDMQCRVSDVTSDNAHEMLLDSSSLSGSFLSMGRRSSSRKSNTLAETDTKLQVSLDVVCDPSKEVHVESEKYKGKLEHVDNLEDQESHKQSIDTPDLDNKHFKLCAGIRSEASPADIGSHEETILELLNSDPSSVLTDALQCDDQSDHAKKVIPPEQPPVSSPTTCSPTKQLPHEEAKALAITSEKTEQPSPVSVLDSPFQEETPSPKGFKQISSDLQELRLRIRLLKFDGPEDHASREADVFSERACNSPSEASVTPVSKLPLTENMSIEYLESDSISCPRDKLSDFRYVRDVLVISGFMGDGIFSRWHLPNHPLDPLLFEKIEKLHGFNNEVGKTDAHESKWERHLLFDCINEVLLQTLGPFFNHHPWLKDAKSSFRRMPAGKQLLRDTWAAISHDFYKGAESEDTLENILAKTMDKGGHWMELQNDVEAVGSQVERAIFGNLIEEAIFDLVL